MDRYGNASSLPACFDHDASVGGATNGRKEATRQFVGVFEPMISLQLPIAAESIDVMGRRRKNPLFPINSIENLLSGEHFDRVAAIGSIDFLFMFHGSMRMTLVKNFLPVALVLAALVFVGCQKKQKVVTNPEKQRELAELEQRMNQRDKEFESQQNKNIPPQTVSVSGLFVSSPADLSQTDPNAMSVDSTPERVLNEFLTLLRQGERFSAQRLLTEAAQQETARASLELDAPGDKNTTFTILSARYATSEQVMAEVDCLFHQKDYQGDSIKLSWMMRRQANGWKVYGMLINLADGELDLVSFENATDLARIQQSVELPNTDLATPPERQANLDPDALKYR